MKIVCFENLKLEALPSEGEGIVCLEHRNYTNRFPCNPFFTSMVNIAYLLLGTNLGNRSLNLSQATAMITQTIGLVTAASSIYETEPWGVTGQPNYRNQVLATETALEPMAMLAQIHEIEKSLGRKRRIRWEARLIDIDILYYNDWLIESPTLVVPHARLAERRFVLAPLAEIAPDFVHPVLKKTNRDLLEECPDLLAVSKMD